MMATGEPSRASVARISPGLTRYQFTAATQSLSKTRTTCSTAPLSGWMAHTKLTADFLCFIKDHCCRNPPVNHRIINIWKGCTESIYSSLLRWLQTAVRFPPNLLLRLNKPCPRSVFCYIMNLFHGGKGPIIPQCSPILQNNFCVTSVSVALVAYLDLKHLSKGIIIQCYMVEITGCDT